MKVKRYLLKLLKRLQLKKLGKCYESIDVLPIYNWFKVFETKDYKYLVESGEVEGDYLEGLWVRLFDEYVGYFGLSNELKEYLNYQKKIAILEIDYALTRKEYIKFKINAEIKKFEELNPVSESESDFMELVAKVSDAKNRDIDIHKVSVRLFYNYLKTMK